MSRPRNSVGRQARGFTLLEVVVALAILAMSLTVFLQTQAASLANAGRSRNLTFATLLARSKMIDIEQQLVDEGFTLGTVEDDGDFGEEGHADYKWHSRLSEIELEMGSLSSLCGALGGDDDAQESSCEAMVSGLGAPLESLLGEVGHSLRLVELTVRWPDGRYEESMSVTTLLTREDMAAGAAPTPGGGIFPQPDVGREAR